MAACAGAVADRSEVAKQTGVTTRTLRYGEELGLLEPAKPDPTGASGTVRRGPCAR